MGKGCMPLDLGLCSKCKHEPRIYRTHKYCKECKRDYEANRRAKPPLTPSTTASDMSDTEPPTLPDTGSTVHDTLYVMRYDFDPCGTMGLKIGRATDVQVRARQLATSHNFRMHVLATFTGWGFLESRVHAMLAASRATGGSGREWFDVSLDNACSVIAAAMFNDRASAAV